MGTRCTPSSVTPDFFLCPPISVCVQKVNSVAQHRRDSTPLFPFFFFSFYTLSSFLVSWVDIRSPFPPRFADSFPASDPPFPHKQFLPPHWFCRRLPPLNLPTAFAFLFFHYNYAPRPCFSSNECPPSSEFEQASTSLLFLFFWGLLCFVAVEFWFPSLASPISSIPFLTRLQ